MGQAFFINSLCFLLLYFLITNGSGRLAHYKGLKVNYTRKINHFALFFIPLLVDALIPYEITPERGMARIGLFMLCIFVMLKPIRSRVSFVNFMFIGFDRPEDRPHTMFWMSSQMTAGLMVIVALHVYFTSLGLEALIAIPVIVNVFGDGLAEPVGVRFGKHKYQTKALFSKVKYTRSLEGSAMVFIAAVVSILVVASHFSGIQLIAALFIIPIVMTLTEAFSPHTWDTPFIFLVGGLMPLFILWAF